MEVSVSILSEKDNYISAIKKIDKTEEAIFIFFAIKKKTKAKIKTIMKMFKQIKDNGGKTTSCMKVKSSFREP